jgi:hypothetical protein
MTNSRNESDPGEWILRRSVVWRLVTANPARLRDGNLERGWC